MRCMGLLMVCANAPEPTQHTHMSAKNKRSFPIRITDDLLGITCLCMALHQCLAAFG